MVNSFVFIFLSCKTVLAMTLGAYTPGFAFLGQSSVSPCAGSTTVSVSAYSIGVLTIV